MVLKSFKHRLLFLFFFQFPVCSAIFKSFKTEVQVKIPQLVFLPDGSHFKKMRL